MVQLTPIKGFINTPVSRSMCVVGTISALGVSIFQIKHYFLLGLAPYIVEYRQFWRILTFQLTMTSESDYLLGILLIFQFKPLERYYGSRKYMSMICVYFLYNMIFCFLFMWFVQLLVYFVSYAFSVVVHGGRPKAAFQLLNNVVPGPFGLISSLYVDYGRFVPVSYRFKVLLTNIFKQRNRQEENDNAGEAENDGPSKSLTLTNHFPVEIVYILLLFNRGLSSFLPCIIGLCIGKLNAGGFLPGTNSWLVPQVVFYAVVSPKRFTRYLRSSIRNRLHPNYQPLASQAEASAEIIDNDNSNGLDDDRVVDLDGSRNEDNEIRAETPVRNLRSQFLDTFRT